MQEEFERWMRSFDPDQSLTLAAEYPFYASYVTSMAAGAFESRQAEIDTLKADAERYRWLADQDIDDRIFIVSGRNGTWGECGHSGFGGLKDLIDEVVDAAMKKG